MPAFYERFRAGRPAFWRLNDDLLGTVRSRRGNLAQVRAFRRPTRVVFGAADPYLNARVARNFHQQFAGSELHLLPNAGHYVQVDEPEQVARLILTLPPGGLIATRALEAMSVGTTPHTRGREPDPGPRHGQEHRVPVP